MSDHATINRGIIAAQMVPVPPKTVHFRYTKDDGTVTERHVEPYEIKRMGEKGRLQLVCHDVEKDQIRRFWLDSMDNVTAGEAFAPRMNITTPL